MPTHEINAVTAGTWRLGDLTVNRIGFGAKRLRTGVGIGDDAPINYDGAIRLLRRAVELGVNHIDTAALVNIETAMTRRTTASATDLVRHGRRTRDCAPAAVVAITAASAGTGPSSS
jgi:diketogulonate reductase-like aldo/keto reductase